MSDQYNGTTVYLDGFLAGYNGYANANPYGPDLYPKNVAPWEAYENGHADGVAAKKRASNAEPTA